MSSDAMEQFTEWFNQWVLDHGISNYHGGGFKKGVGNADVDLPMLESAIHDLIAEARALVAADAISQIGHVLSGPGVGSVAWLGLNELRGELAEIADPGGLCASCGHIEQPEYRHGTADHIPRRPAGSIPAAGRPGPGRRQPDGPGPVTPDPDAHAAAAARIIEDANRTKVSVAAAQVHALLAIHGQIAGLGGSLELAARLLSAGPDMTLPDPDCPHCHGQGYTEGPGCNCGAGPSGYYGAHERYCGLEPCPAGCPFVPPRPPARLGGGD